MFDFVKGKGSIHASTLQSSSFVGWAVGSSVALIAWQQIGLSHPRGSPGALLHGGCYPFYKTRKTIACALRLPRKTSSTMWGKRREKGGWGEKKREILFLTKVLVGLGSVPWFKVLHGGKKKFLFFSISSFFFSFLFLHLVKNFLSFIR